MDFRAGDRVRFKDIDEIHRLLDLGELRFGWADEMDRLCGMEFTIKRIVNPKVYFKEDARELHSDRYSLSWNISTSMLELIEDNKEAAEAIMTDDRILDMVMC